MYYATSKALSIMVFAILHLRQNLPSNVHPLGFSDSSHAADPDDRKSHSGYIYFMFNGAIIWSSSKQSIVTLSSMEAEYIELTDAAKEAIFLRKLLASLNMDINDPTMILTDSESALDYVKNMSNTPVLSILIHDFTIFGQYTLHLPSKLILNTFLIANKLPTSSQSPSASINMLTLSNSCNSHNFPSKRALKPPRFHFNFNFYFSSATPSPLRI